MQDQVRITVIATGLQDERGAAVLHGLLAQGPVRLHRAQRPGAVQQPASSFSTTTSNGRFADEDYIPDFLKRQR